MSDHVVGVVEFKGLTFFANGEVRPTPILPRSI